MSDKIKCVKCKEFKNTDLFPIRKDLKRGFDSWCKDCHSIARKEHQNTKEYKATAKIRDANKCQERVSWLRALKESPCTDCGIQYDPMCMDFDHLDPTTKILSVSRMNLNGTNKEDILAEIAKCELVCVLCHNIRTQKRFDEKYPVKKYKKSNIRNIKIINEAKNKPCVICSKQYDTINMQLDHIDPSTKFKNVCQLKSCKTETLLAEIAKCQVICALCHRIKSLTEQKENKYIKPKLSTNDLIV